MLMRIFLKTQAGLSLVEMTIVLGLVGIAGLGVATIMGGAADTVKSAEARVAKVEFASALGIYLSSRLGCQDLKSASLLSGDTYSSTDSDMKLTGWNYQGITSMESNTKMRYFSLEKLMGRVDLSPGLPVIEMTYSDGSTKNLMKTMLTVTAMLKMGNNNYKHEFHIPVMMDSANKVELCGDERTLAETCTALNGTFIPSTSQCTFDQTCAIQGSYTTLSCFPRFTGGCDTSRGTPQTNPVTNTFGCPLGSSAVATGADTWTIQRDCGKKCTADINNTLGYYTCLKCP